MFHLPPLAEAFVRGYYDVYQILLKLGAKPILGLDRNFFRSFGIELFDIGTKGRRHFIQLLYDHGNTHKSSKIPNDFLLGGDIETQFKVHAIRIESDGTTCFEPYLKFSCDPICVADVDPSIFIKWICS